MNPIYFPYRILRAIYPSGWVMLKGAFNLAPNFGHIQPYRS